MIEAATSRDFTGMMNEEACWTGECNAMLCEESEFQMDRLLAANRQPLVGASAPPLRVPVVTLIVNGRKVQGL